MTLDSEGLALEARLAYPQHAPRSAAVLICPPHPFLGGDMDNNVVTALRDALVDAGLAVLRFNYRGIGASETARDLGSDLAEFWRDSTCPAYEREIHRDCSAALSFLHDEQAGAPLLVTGYSFGCLPAIALCANPAVERLLLIAPPLARWQPGVPRSQPRLRCALFYAPGDFACPAGLVDALYATLPGPKRMRTFADADHFFVGHERTLAAAAVEFLTVA